MKFFENTLLEYGIKIGSPCSFILMGLTMNSKDDNKVYLNDFVIDQLEKIFKVPFKEFYPYLKLMDKYGIIAFGKDDFKDITFNPKVIWLGKMQDYKKFCKDPDIIKKFHLDNSELTQMFQYEMSLILKINHMLNGKRNYNS